MLPYEKYIRESVKTDWARVKQEVPAWFADAKFGMFFHWAPYSVPAFQNEWYSRNMYARGLEQNIHHEKTYGRLHDFGYKDFIPMFRAEAFDPEAWADLVEMAGAKYAGPVSEHADNFSLWDSAVNPVNAAKCGPRRDVLGECFSAFSRRGIKTLATFHHQWLWGWFMSTDNEADVYDPANEIFYGPALPLETNRYEPYRYPDASFSMTWQNKVLEVIDKYDPDVIYFDSRCFIIGEKYRFRIPDYYYNKTGHRHGIITYKQEDFPEGIGVLDLERGHLANARPFPWQCDDRLEDNVTWCMVQEPKYRSAADVIRQLCDIVAKNGNLLLNVGPYADGSFHPRAVAVLKEIGSWLRQNGEAIYGTRPFCISQEGPAAEKDSDYDTELLKRQLQEGGESSLTVQKTGAHDIRFTTKDGFIYAIFMGWPEDGTVRIKTLRRHNTAYIKPISEVKLTGFPGELEFMQTEEALSVKLPPHKPCEHAWVLKNR